MGNKLTKRSLKWLQYKLEAEADKLNKLDFLNVCEDTKQISDEQVECLEYMIMLIKDEIKYVEENQD